MQATVKRGGARERFRRRNPGGAEHRRRRVTALGVLAALAAGAGAVVGSGSSGRDVVFAPTGDPYCQRSGGTATRELAGQGVLVRMGASATPRLRALARRGEIGGVILFPPSGIDPSALARQIRALQAAASRGERPALLVTIDQEGGIVERLPTLPPQLSPYTLAQNDDPGAARLEGEATGLQLRRIGIGVDLAPVLDVPISSEQFMASRAFGSSPQQVSRLGLAFARGLLSQRVAPAAKHFPGLGRARENTDFAPTAIDASKQALRADWTPFEDAITAGVPAIMVSLAAYPALGDGSSPAALSPAIVTTELRDRLGFEGVVVSDDLLAPAVANEHPPRQAALLATIAGVDLKLFARAPARGIAEALAAATGRGRLDISSLRASCERILALKGALADGSISDGSGRRQPTPTGR